ncbi:MAG: c-type cytochrome [Anaerolineae bacterium]|nr:c-type cytochrome [Anaerolineae bacterium]
MRYWIVVLFCVLLLVACSGNADSTPTAPPSVTLSPEAARGKTVFSQNCGSCHSTIPETVIVGPSLADIATNAETRKPGQDGRAYLYTAILQPGDFLVEGYDNLMPATFGKQLTGEDLDAVVAYLLTLE